MHENSSTRTIFIRQADMEVSGNCKQLENQGLAKIYYRKVQFNK